MRDSSTINHRPSGLTLTWTPIRDERGRSRLEARWSLASTVATASTAATSPAPHAA